MEARRATGGAILMQEHEFQDVVNRLRKIIELGEENNHVVKGSIDHALDQLERQFAKKLAPNDDFVHAITNIIKAESKTEVLETIEKFETEHSYDHRSCLRVNLSGAKKMTKERWI